MNDNLECEQTLLVQADFDGELEASRAAALVEHVAQCRQCQLVSEQLERPGEQIFDVIRYFGSRKKIFSVHFRNIEGGFLNFRETFIDNGSVDMLKAMRTYKEVGYDGMMMPDHVPAIEGLSSELGFAFAFGYIKALIAAVAAEG